jgi:uncharacterized protein with HEPN domain
MLEACERISTYVEDVDSVAFREDRKTVDAVVRNLEILGEAAKAVSDPTRALAPEIPWQAIAGFRDVLIHQYFGVDLEIVSDVTYSKVPTLRVQLVELLRRLGSGAARIGDLG